MPARARSRFAPRISRMRSRNLGVMQIYIKPKFEKRFLLDVSISNTILQLKVKIQTEMAFSPVGSTYWNDLPSVPCNPDLQHLSLKRTQMTESGYRLQTKEECYTVADYGIAHHQTIVSQWSEDDMENHYNLYDDVPSDHSGMYTDTDEE